MSDMLVRQAPGPDTDDFGLSEIAKHNAEHPHQSTEHFPAYTEDTKGLGIYVSISPAFCSSGVY